MDVFEKSSFHSGNLKIFKNHEGDLSPKLPKANM